MYFTRIWRISRLRSKHFTWPTAKFHCVPAGQARLVVGGQVIVDGHNTTGNLVLIEPVNVLHGSFAAPVVARQIDTIVIGAGANVVGNDIRTGNGVADEGIVLDRGIVADVQSKQGGSIQEAWQINFYPNGSNAEIIEIILKKLEDI